MEMFHRRKFAALFIAFMIFLCVGCASQRSDQGSYRVVTKIDVHYYKKPLVSEGSFSDPEKMQKILYYLRKISPYGTPTENPEQVQGSDFYITLFYSDHTTKTFQQRDNRFMRINGGPWKRIDPKRALMLSQILGTLDSDTSDPNASATPFLMPTE